MAEVRCRSLIWEKTTVIKERGRMDPIAIACRYHIHSKKFHYLYDLTKLIFETKTGMDFGEKSAEVAEYSAARSHYQEERGTEMDA